jgi:HK97 family phage portal protein
MLNWLKRRFLPSNLTQDGSMSLSDWADEIYGSDGEASIDVNYESALGIPPLWRAVNIVSNDVGRLRCRAFERLADNERRRATEHPSYRLINRKSGICNSFQFRRTLTLHAQLHGNGFARIRRNQRGEPIRLEILPPAPLTYPVIESTTRGERVVVVTHIGDTAKALPIEDVIHIPGLSYDGCSGLSIIDVLEASLKGAIATQRYTTLYYEQGGSVKGYLKVPNILKQEQAKDLRDNWGRLADGMGNTGKIAVAHGGAEYVELKANANDAQLLPAKQFSIIDISNVTGVRPHDLGDQTRAAYNSLEQENQSHADRCIEPWLVTWELEYMEKLLTEQQKDADSHYIEFDRRGLIRHSLTELAEADRKYREMGKYSVNDLRRRDNEEPVDGGDVYHIPVNWGVLNQTVQSVDEQ